MNDIKNELKHEHEKWEKKILKPVLKAKPERKPNKQFSSVSSHTYTRLATPIDLENSEFTKDIGWPGQYPYTRGIHATMYRGKLWTMRQFAGFGSAEDTNKRFRYLLEQGQTGLSVAFDLPTLMGYDSDHELSLGGVGVEGVAIDTLEDMRILFNGIPLDKVSTSMTINCPAPILLAMLIAIAEEQNVPLYKLRGTLQADILKEYIAQKEWIYPPEPSVRLMVDIFDYCSKYLPKFNTVSISGYHIREAGSTAIQELAFTLADGIAYVQAAIDASLDIDLIVPRFSFFFNCHNDFFEEISKFRAARRIWAKIMRDRFHAKNPDSWKLRTHAQTAGCSLTAQQPLNNVARVAIQALAAVLGGTQSLHTNSMDETLALPTEQAVTVALRTQQIIAEESGVANTVDPLGGSYFVERMTNEIQAQALEYIAKIDKMGGMIKAIENGYPQREIGGASFKYQTQIEAKEKTIVGVNDYVTDSHGQEIETLRIPPETARNQIERLNNVKARRDQATVVNALNLLIQAAQGQENTFPYILNAVKTMATLKEICDALKTVFGEYKEASMF